MRQSLLSSMANSLKKVILRKWNGDWMSGYLPASLVVRDGAVDLLDMSGKVLSTSLAELKWICFVRDFNSGEIANPERLMRKVFAGRPRATGVWVRAKLKDDDVLEGLAANDSTLLTSLGIAFAPPDTRSNTQRIFLPATSLSLFEVVAVIGSPARMVDRQRPLKKGRAAQPDLFPKQEPN